MIRALKQLSDSGTWKLEGEHPSFLASWCYWTGTGLERVCGRPARSVWVLDFAQERLPNASPSDSESTFIKAGDSKTKEGLGMGEATGESLGALCLGSLKNV